MKSNRIRNGLVATAAVMSLALAGCEKPASLPVEKAPAAAGCSTGTLFTEELTVPKDHYFVGESGRVYTSGSPEALEKWVLDATLEGSAVCIRYDRDSGSWNGRIVRK